MAEITGISWTDHTQNICWGCDRVSPACDHCYAEALSKRYGFDVWGADKPRRTFGEKHWNEPLRWNQTAQKEGKRHRVFCSSMCDVFENHPTVIGELKKLWPLIRQTPWLDWQLLTKRPHRIKASLPGDWGTGYPNVWLGTTIESNDYRHRANHLISAPARVHFISYEPALGPLDLLPLKDIEWVIGGGESGPHYRPFEMSWMRDIRDRCAAAGIAFWFKQAAAFRSGTNPLLDGVKIQQFPKGEES